MNISYSRPLELGWQRMKRTLFQPFDLGRWMVLGFTAWLAQLADSSGGGSSSGGDVFQIREDVGDEGFLSSAGAAWQWLADLAGDTVGVLLIAFILVGILVISLLLLWLSSRGRFMFLDNLIHNRTEVTHPWQEYRVEGDSLFLWQFVYALVVLVIVGTIMAGFLVMVVPNAFFDLPGSISLLAAISLGMILFCVVTVLAYVEYFLTQFIVPIMHKRRVSTTEAWGIFLPLFRAQPAAFVLFGLFYMVIVIAMSIAFVIGGALTCCLGLLLMALPYIGSVVTLPMSVLGRFMNLEFLAQFGDDFNLLAPLPEMPLPEPPLPGSGQFHADGAVIRTEDPGEDTGGDQTGSQDS